MTSVPQFRGRIADVKDNDESSITLNSSISPRLLKIRHIKSIIIQNICEIEHQDPNVKKGNQKINRAKTTKNISFEDTDNEDDKTGEIINPVTKKVSRSSSMHKIRKGKSTYDLKHSFPGNSNDESEDTFISNKGKNDLNHEKSLLKQPIEIQRQLELQYNKDNEIVESFYTLNDFLNIDKPYFISRTFPSDVELDDELELRIFSNSATINLFAKFKNDRWKLLKQYHLKLSLLINIGNDSELIMKTLKGRKNLLILQMTDGCYYILPNTSIPTQTIKYLKTVYFDSVMERVDMTVYHANSCTYDQIRVINNYSKCIHDLLITKQILKNKIDKELENNNGFRNNQYLLNKTNTSINQLSKILEKRKLHNKQLKERISQMNEIKDIINSNIKNAKDDIKIDVQEEICKLEIDIENNKKLINIEKARVASIIQYIFPIKESENNFSFTLFNTSYPSSLIPQYRISINEIPYSIISTSTIQKLMNISKQESERLNAIIGYIGLIISKIADILQIPLRYPIKYLGSTSYIHDPISSSGYYSLPIGKENSNTISGKPMIYPLFICQNITLVNKFTYGLLLLRKNLEQIYDIEHIVKIEEFNLLIACKIWLTCVECYADMNNEIPDIQMDNLYNDEDVVDDEEADVNDDDDDNDEDKLDKLSPLLTATLNNPIRRVSGCSKKSRQSNISINSVSSANFVVNEYNKNLLTEERIKHIKKHLLKGIVDNK